MQNNCQKLKLPFEVLIQGPSGNRFIRDMISADPVYEGMYNSEKDVDRKTRSTISIYRPEENAEFEQYLQQLEADHQIDGESDSVLLLPHQFPMEGFNGNEQIRPERETQAESIDNDHTQSGSDEFSLDSHSNESTPKDTETNTDEQKFSELKTVSEVDSHIEPELSTLLEQSNLFKRETEDEVNENVGAAKIIVQPTTTTEAPIPDKKSLIEDAVIRTKTNLQTMQERNAAQRAQISANIHNALENVRNKITQNLPTIPTTAAPPVVPAVQPKPVLPLFKRNEPNVGSIQTVKVIPVPNISAWPRNPVLPTSTKLVIQPKPIVNPIQTMQNNLASRKAVLQAGGLPVVSFC